MSRRKARLSKFLDFLEKVFEEPQGGGPSATRLAAFLVASNIMICWTYLILKKGEWIPMGWDMVTLVGSVIGIKVVQKFAETRSKGNPLDPLGKRRDG